MKKPYGKSLYLGIPAALVLILVFLGGMGHLSFFSERITLIFAKNEAVATFEKVAAEDPAPAEPRIPPASQGVVDEKSGPGEAAVAEAAKPRFSSPATDAKKPKMRLTTVEREETLYAVLRREYGQANTMLLDYVLSANPEISHPHQVSPGTRIRIPVLSEDSLVQPSWRGDFRIHLAIPIVCVPASINNDLPGSELSVGADTALNSIVRDVDKIKQSAVASQRTFVVEVMGQECGYLALMSGLATDAERVYLPEEGISLRDLQADVEALSAGFARGKRLGLVIRGEKADDVYTTSFIKALFEREGGDLFDVREAVLGHVQQGGSPPPFDRIQATRLASSSIRQLIDVANRSEPRA